MLPEHIRMEIRPSDKHFRKEERLCGEIRTGKLFSQGKGFIVYPLRFVYRISDVEESAAVRLLISVPKKKIRHATDRNKIKRLLREAYRLNKYLITVEMAEKGIFVHTGIIYLSNEISEYSVIEEKVITGLKKLRKHLASAE